MFPMKIVLWRIYLLVLNIGEGMIHWLTINNDPFPDSHPFPTFSTSKYSRFSNKPNWMPMFTVDFTVASRFQNSTGEAWPGFHLQLPLPGHVGLKPGKRLCWSPAKGMHIVCPYVCCSMLSVCCSMCACMQAGRQLGRQAGRQTDRQAGRQTGRQTVRRQVGRYATYVMYMMYGMYVIYVMYGLHAMWVCMIMFDYVGLCMIMYDYVWWCMIMYDYVWLCMTL